MNLAISIPGFDQLVELMKWLLTQIHVTTGLTWGWSIIALTVLVRLALVPLTVKQQQSMRQMQALQPEIKQIQEKHKGDRAAQQQELMEFYKERGVNPFGSCLPLVAQIPVFISLYVALRDTEHFQDGTPLNFLGSFIPDVTEPLNHMKTDNFSTLVVLAVVYIGSQMLSTLLVPSTVDKTQKYLFLFLPVLFGVFIINSGSPVGLMIYWITSNFWTVGQGAVIRQFYPPPIIQQQKADQAAKELAEQKKEERKEAARVRKAAAADAPPASTAKPQRPVRRPQKPPRQRRPPAQGAPPPDVPPAKGGDGT